MSDQIAQVLVERNAVYVVGALERTFGVHVEVHVLTGLRKCRFMSFGYPRVLMNWETIATSTVEGVAGYVAGRMGLTYEEDAK